MTDSIQITTSVSRKSPSLPRFVEVPAYSVAPWDVSGTTPVEVSLNGVDIGRRNLKSWGHGRDCWFFELPATSCRKAGVDTGDDVAVRLTLATTELPSELSSLIKTNSDAMRRWEAMTASQQRMLADRVREAKQAATRERRAKGGLCGQ
jgi:hypothetical protein